MPNISCPHYLPGTAYELVVTESVELRGISYYKEDKLEQKYDVVTVHIVSQKQLFPLLFQNTANNVFLSFNLIVGFLQICFQC